MRDKELYTAILGIERPWVVVDVDLDPDDEEVTVRIEFRGSGVSCPQCGRNCPRHDHRTRSWRHLDTCQYRTVLSVEVPRAKCDEHGVHQIRVPWGEPGSGFTALFEALVIDWLLETSIAAVARRMRLSWDQVYGIRSRAVRRGMARRKLGDLRRLGVDETSFQKRHEYVTVVNDTDRSRVLYVADGRGNGTLDGFYEQLPPPQLKGIEAVSMDMWGPYIRGTLQHVPDAEHKIAFDRFHVAKRLGEAVNDVRKKEHRELRAAGNGTLLRTKYLWLQNPENMTEKNHARFEELRNSNLKVARAWAIKETARDLWRYVKRGWALKAWKQWLGWAMRSRLAPIKKAAIHIRDHLWGILNAVVLKATNAASEGLNAKIQWVKKNACGFRNRERFREAIYFHCGGLDLYPDPLGSHTDS